MATYRIDNIAYPINWEEKDRVQKTLQHAKNMLMCRMGEVPYDRYRGFDPALFDLPMGQMQAELLPELDRIMLWEPDVEVVDAKAFPMDNGYTYISATIEITYL